MLKQVLLWAPMLAGFGCPPAIAQEVVEWKTVNAWRIAVDKTLGNGCFMETSYEGGSIVRAGFWPNEKSIVFGIGNMAWSSIEVGKDYNITIQMDNGEPWNAPARGTRLDGLPMLMTKTQNTDFLIELKRKQGVVVSFGGKRVASLTLKGSSSAVDAVIECQQIMNGTNTPQASTPPKDPFAPSTPQPASDPFKL